MSSPARITAGDKAASRPSRPPARAARPLAWPLAFLLLLLGFSAAAAADHRRIDGRDGYEDSERGAVELKVSRGKTLRLPGKASNIFVADPSIADIQAPQSDIVFIFGKKPGRTSLFALADGGRPIMERQVVVLQPIEDLHELLRTELPGHNIQVTYTPNGATISGMVPNAAIAEQAKSAVSQFLGPGSIVSNRLRVAGGQQVNLRVRVAEVSRDVTKQFGINLNAVVQSGDFRFGLVTGRGAMVGPGGVSRSGSGGGSAFLGYSGGGTNISAVLDALAQEGLVSILAEPNLTAASGETANFLAGGEFPIPVNQGLDRVSVEFKRFGVALSFTPTVLSGEQISVRVQPEVSDISTRGAVQINGFNIPAISTRRADTTVELGSGQSFAIGGLIRKGFNSDVSMFPFLGDLPILGALFRSSNFQKNESELIIIVTPYLVRPATGAQAMRVPTERVAPASDGGRILYNQLAQPPVGRSAPVARSPRKLREPAFLVD